MRFVPVSSLMEGMVVGKNLYDANQMLLLRQGAIIQKNYVNRILELGYQGLYIDDEISKDIEIKDVISDDLRLKTVKAVEDLFIHTTISEDLSLAQQKVISKKIDGVKLLVKNIVEDLLENQDTMVNLVDLKIYDDYTFYHSVNVAVLSLLIASKTRLSRDDMTDLGVAAILHDIGKMFIDINILNKPDKLEDSEFLKIKRHSEFGYNFLKETYEIPIRSYVGILQHHEKFDGTGYPLSRKGEDIHLFSRIITVADVYDALISTRPYRRALLPSEAMELIMGAGGTQFDYNITKIFAQKVAPFPIGTYVKLSNGYIGIVTENHAESCMRPKIRCMMDNHNKVMMPRMIDLSYDRNVRNITIVEVIKDLTF